MGPLEIDDETVLKNLNLWKNKSPGPDMVSPKFVKDLCKPITTIFTTSLKSMKTPNVWKKAQVSALAKKGDRKLASNYRPISLTSILCKWMEDIVRDHMIRLYEQKEPFF